MLSDFGWLIPVLWCYAFVLIVLSGEPRQTKGNGWSRRLFCCGSLMILDVAWCYVWLF